MPNKANTLSIFTRAETSHTACLYELAMKTTTWLFLRSCKPRKAGFEHSDSEWSCKKERFTSPGSTVKANHILTPLNSLSGDAPASVTSHLATNRHYTH